jgi:hypothetical protein
MGDFNYSMNPDTGNGMHSITFESNGLKLNTWSTWKMAPKSRPFVAAPQVKTEYIDVPGADGALDYTEALTGKPRYANRTGQWDFIIDNGYSNWYELYSEILLRLHGKRFEKIILDDDDDYYWSGRLSVTGQFGNKDYSSISIQYNLDPYKYPLDKLKTNGWKWNDLFSNIIHYNKFSVNNIKTHTLISENESTCVINVTSPLKVYRASDEDEVYAMIQSEFNPVLYWPIYLATGDNDFVLYPGENILVFKGNSILRLEYSGGKLL